MANQITGRLVEIGRTQEIETKNGGSPFRKREFLLDATSYDPWTGERSQYENIVPLEVSGDRCADLDRFKEGDVITVSFVLQGRYWTTESGEQKRMTGIRCYRIEGRGATNQASQAAQHQAARKADAGCFPPEVDERGVPKDDLPF